MPRRRVDRVGDLPGQHELVTGAPLSQDARWNADRAAARQFHAREGRLAVPRKAVETVDGAEHKLGAWLGNARRRAVKPGPQRRAGLDAINMRWWPVPAGRDGGPPRGIRDGPPACTWS
ncbi:helicase associated domain-containing protein [Streptomyces sp. NPDC051987]|uniref:helicase associated domain-containing protein n=1 Tax=Streptomyces sp. NPDC051987 TaxID=3155808 RepID=UPI00343D4757